MLELLSAILIIAVLATMVTFFTASYIQWSQQTSDKQTLTILNDALTRYKGEGGNVAALTAGAPVGHVVTALQTAVTWGGQGGINHIFLNTGKTYLGRSLSVLGTGAQYRFTRYNTYTNEPGGVTNPNINTAAGGLVGWWKLDEGSGTTAGDSAGGNVGTLTGATLPPWVVGRSGTGNALQFNGSGYVNCGSSIGDFPGNAPFSVSCWVYVTSFIPNNWGRLSLTRFIFHGYLRAFSDFLRTRSGASGNSFCLTAFNVPANRLASGVAQWVLRNLFHVCAKGR